MNESSECTPATDSSYPLRIPPDRTLYPFQIETIRKTIAFLTKEKSSHTALVANEMGLGKSITSIVTANTLGASRILILCPSSMRLVLEQEIYAWSRFTVTAVPRVAVVLSKDDLPDTVNAQWVIISYDLSWKEEALKCLKKQSFDLLIADEYHYVRNYTAKRTKAFYKHIWMLAPRRLLLTGTPVVRCVTDLFLPVAKITPNFPFAQSFPLFANRYAYQKVTQWATEYYGLRKENVKELSDHIRENFYIRYTKAEVLKELPPKVFQKIFLPKELSLEVKESEASTTRVDAERVLEDLERGASFQISKSLAEHRRRQGELKVPAVAAFATDLLEAGIPIVLFAHHKSVIDALAQALADFKPVIIQGETSPEERLKAVESFQNGETDLFIGNIVAAGTGITLTRASHVLFAELSWLPGEVAQATDRCHRITQKDSVNVYWFVAMSSLDERIADVIVKRAREIYQVCDTASN